MVTKSTPGEKIFSVINNILLIVLTIVCAYPVIHVLAASFSDPDNLMVHQGVLFWPMGFTTKGYELVLQNPNIISGFKNTSIYVVLGTTISMLLTSMGAYVLSRKRVYFGRHMMVIVTFTMFFGGGLIPFYLLVKNLKLLNTIWSIVLPNAISTYNLIIMRTSFMTIPDSLEESARIDGANDFLILFRIILPLSKPVIAVLILFYAVGNWNAWFDAMLFLKDKSLYPLQLIVREILITNDKNSMLTKISPAQIDKYRYLIQYSTIIIASLPVFIVYPSLQKYFTKGIMIGSLKE